MHNVKFFKTSNKNVQLNKMIRFECLKPNGFFKPITCIWIYGSSVPHFMPIFLHVCPDSETPPLELHIDFLLALGFVKVEIESV